MHGMFLQRRRGKRVPRLIRARRHIIYTLLDDAQALAHFFHVDDTAVVTITMKGCRDIELELVIRGIGKFLAKIPDGPSFLKKSTVKSKKSKEIKVIDEKFKFLIQHFN